MMVSWETGELLVEEVQQGKDSGVKRLAERQPEEMGPGNSPFIAVACWVGGPVFRGSWRR